MTSALPSLEQIPHNKCSKTLYQKHLILHKRSNSNGSKLHYLKTSNSLNEMSKTVIDKEALYEENILLKTELNKLRSDLSYAKSTSIKKEFEIAKKDKMIKLVLDENNANHDYDFDSAKDSNLVSKLKKQYNLLKKQLEDKENDISFLRHNIRNSKLNEYIIENQTIYTQLQKINELYVYAMKENELNEIKLRQMNDIQSQFAKQHFIILSLQDNIKKLSEENSNLKEEKEKMKVQINSIRYDLKKLKQKLSNASNEIGSDNDYQKQIQALNKRLKIYEEIVLSNNNYKANPTMNKSNKNYKDKVIQNTNINDLQKQIDQLQSLLSDVLSDKNQLESENNRLKIELNSYTSSSDHQQSNDQLNEITYILMKVFEANNISKHMAMTLILQPILNNLESETQIEKSDLQEQIVSKISEILNCINNANDISKLNFFIKSLLKSSENDLGKFVEIFLNIFENNLLYTDEMILKMTIKVRRKLVPYYEYLNTYWSNSKSAFISFFTFRTILLEGGIVLDDNMIEFIIYRMKCVDEKDKEQYQSFWSIFDLNFEKLINMINMKKIEAEDDIILSDDDNNNNEIKLEKDEYNKILTLLFIEIQKKMQEKAITSIEELIGKNDLKGESKRKINIQIFIKKLKEVLDIKVSEIQLNCLYNKTQTTISNTNQTDDELISIDLLENELHSASK